MPSDHAKPATTHMDPVVAQRLRRGALTHLEVPGTRRADGPSIPGFYERPTFQADTVCGQRLAVGWMTKTPGVNVTCPTCSGSRCTGDPCTCRNGIGCVNVPVEEW